MVISPNNLSRVLEGDEAAPYATGGRLHPFLQAYTSALRLVIYPFFYQYLVIIRKETAMKYSIGKVILLEVPLKTGDSPFLPNHGLFLA